MQFGLLLTQLSKMWTSKLNWMKEFWNVTYHNTYYTYCSHASQLSQSILDLWTVVTFIHLNHCVIRSCTVQHTLCHTTVTAGGLWKHHYTIIRYCCFHIFRSCFIRLAATHRWKWPDEARLKKSTCQHQHSGTHLKHRKHKYVTTLPLYTFAVFFNSTLISRSTYSILSPSNFYVIK